MDIDKLINWSEVSRLLTNERSQIRSGYDGKKYKKAIDRLRRIIALWVKWQEKVK